MTNPNGEKCESCLYFRTGQCRRNPPEVYTDGGIPNGAWPLVNETDWCGEWAPIQEENPA